MAGLLFRSRQIFSAEHDVLPEKPSISRRPAIFAAATVISAWNQRHLCSGIRFPRGECHSPRRRRRGDSGHWGRGGHRRPLAPRPARGIRLRRHCAAGPQALTESRAWRVVLPRSPTASSPAQPSFSSPVTAMLPAENASGHRRVSAREGSTGHSCGGRLMDATWMAKER